MKKIKLFLSNFLIFGLGGVIGKIVPLIMVPIVTRMMPETSYFGLSDMASTVVSFASAIAVMGMYDAMYRLFFDKEDEEYKKTVCSTAVTFTFCTSLVVFLLMLLLRFPIASRFFKNGGYAYIVYISAAATLIGATNSIVAAPTRMQNKRGIYLAANTVGPLISYAIAIHLLSAGRYTIALPLAGLISNLTLEASFAILNHKWFHIKLFDRKLLKDLLRIGIPITPNFLIYWVFNSCDKLMITNMIDIGAEGIYAVASKLGHVSQLIYTAFAGGWQFFAFSTMKEENQVESNSRIFEYLGAVSFVASAFICAWSNQLFRWLFPEEYLVGYIVAPYLFLAPLMQMLFQVAANQFLIIKRTLPSMLILLSGAIINIIINLLLIPILGIEGASIATLMGYVISDIVCVIVLCHKKLMILRSRFVGASSMMAIYMVLWRFLFPDKTLAGTAAAILLTAVIILLYRQDILDLACILKMKNKGGESDDYAQ